MSSEGLKNMMLKLTNLRGHKALAMIIQSVRDDIKQFGLSPKKVTHKTNQPEEKSVLYVCGEGQVPCRKADPVLDFLIENKVDIINSIIMEQKFTTTLNSRNQTTEIIKECFQELQTNMTMRLQNMASMIKNNQIQIKELKDSRPFQQP